MLLNRDIMYRIVFLFTCSLIFFVGAGSEKLLKFKKWFWSILEKMTMAQRQDLVSS